MRLRAPFSQPGYAPADHLTEHCTPFFHDCKEKNQKFFSFFQRPPRRCAQNAQNRPKSAENRPQRAQRKPAEQQKIHRRAHQQRREKIQPELAAPGQQRQPHERERAREHEQRVQRRLRAGMPPQHAQRVVNEPQRRARERRRAELRALKRQRQLHQPNSRAKKPPVGASAS